jgi:protein NrfD
MEITVTGANALTYPSLHIWNWMVALYLFLVGVAAGLLIMSAVASLRGKTSDHYERSAAHVVSLGNPNAMKSPQPPFGKGGQEGVFRADCIKVAMIAPFVLMLGVFFIWLDLENKFNFFWIFLSFSPSSPMWWGCWGVCLTVLISLLYGLSLLHEEYRHWLRFGVLKDLSRKVNPYMRILAGICLGLGILLGIYTGISLSIFVARPLWNSALLPVLFLASALSNGAALIIIIAQTKSAQLFFTKANIRLIFAEIIIISLFFLGHLTSAAPQRGSVMPFFAYSHEYFLFGISFILVALFLPLVLILKVLGLEGDHHERITKVVLFRMKLSATMVLAGGFVMMLALVYLGQLSRWS